VAGYIATTQADSHLNHNYRSSSIIKEFAMTQTFKVGDHVSWNSEAGRVSGRIVKVHTKDVNHKGYIHHATKDGPQYEIKSDKTDHVALHKGGALLHLQR
jgi:hypothetical protein